MNEAIAYDDTLAAVLLSTSLVFSSLDIATVNSLTNHLFKEVLENYHQTKVYKGTNPTTTLQSRF